MLYGGHPKLRTHIERLLPELKMDLVWHSGTDRALTQSYSSAEGADLLVLITSMVSHKYFHKVRRASEQFGVPMAYYNGKGAAGLQQFLIDQIYLHKLKRDSEDSQ